MESFIFFSFHIFNCVTVSKLDDYVKRFHGWTRWRHHRLSKDVMLFGLEALDKYLKKFYARPLDARIRAHDELLDFMIAVEYCPNMKRRIRQLKDITNLILTQDGAYRIRWILYLTFLRMMGDRFKMTLYEAELQRKSLWNKGFLNEAKVLWDFVLRDYGMRK